MNKIKKMKRSPIVALLGINKLIKKREPIPIQQFFDKYFKDQTIKGGQYER